VTLKLREPVQSQWRLAGTVVEVEDRAVTLAVQQKKTTETIRLEFDHIALARRKVEFSK
jgi:ribosome maturation factor RimP